MRRRRRLVYNVRRCRMVAMFSPYFRCNLLPEHHGPGRVNHPFLG